MLLPIFTAEKTHTMRTTFLLCAAFLCCAHAAFSQKWVDTNYSIQLTKDIAYGSSIDFAGTNRTHFMNICVPINDTIPICGRPLLLAIHGGAFIAGSKDGDQIPGWIRDFAKRGYVAASINYRLGMFQTDNFINCNISAFGAPWNCLNMQDTAEWYRAAYRGIQDAKGAIRFLLNNASVYHIDPRNVFLVGESAGGFIALSTAFLDDSTEKPIFANAMANVNAPNALYENQCIQTPGFATNIASMNLARPDLGSIDGVMNPSTVAYTIKGVGNFYGAMNKDLFSKYNYSKAPVLYMFHQPNDLVVPYDAGLVEGGVSYCATQFPFNCQYLTNLPWVYGSKGISKMINALSTSGIPLPTYLLDSTTNTSDCLGQISNPSTVGHAVDNPPLRSLHLAQFFAPEVDTTCFPTLLQNVSNQKALVIAPNPANEYFTILGITDAVDIICSDINGRILFKKDDVIAPEKISISTLPKGVYILSIKSTSQTHRIKLLK